MSKYQVKKSAAKKTFLTSLCGIVLLIIVYFVLVLTDAGYIFAFYHSKIFPRKDVIGQPLFNELYKEEYKYLYGPSKEAQMTRIAQKYILIGMAEKQAVDILKANEFRIYALEKGVGNIDYKQIDGIRWGDGHPFGQKKYYVRLKVNNEKVEDVSAFILFMAF